MLLHTLLISRYVSTVTPSIYVYGRVCNNNSWQFEGSQEAYLLYTVHEKGFKQFAGLSMNKRHKKMKCELSGVEPGSGQNFNALTNSANRQPQNNLEYLLYLHVLDI